MLAINPTPSDPEDLGLYDDPDFEDDADGPQHQDIIEAWRRAAAEDETDQAPPLVA